MKGALSRSIDDILTDRLKRANIMDPARHFAAAMTVVIALPLFLAWLVIHPLAGLWRKIGGSVHLCPRAGPRGKLTDSLYYCCFAYSPDLCDRIFRRTRAKKAFRFGIRKILPESSEVLPKNFLK
jgi:hypothetical protein